MSTTTTNLGLTLPTPNVDTGWGSTLNTDFTLIDDIFASGGTGTSVGLNVGSGKTLLLGGNMILGTGDGTGTVTAPTIRGAARTGTNVVGANLTIDASNGTGTGGSGNIIFRTAPSGSSGSTANTLINSVEIGTSLLYSRLRGSFAQTGGGTTGAVQVRQPSGDATPAYIQWVDYNATAQKGFLAFDTANEFIVAPGGTERLRVNSSGSIGLSGANYGSAGQVLTSNGAGSSVSWTTPTTINQSTAQTFSTTGNSFLGIPATAKTITITLAALNPTSDVLVRLGTSSGFVSTGYVSAGSSITASGAATSNSAAGFFIDASGLTMSGSVRLTYVANTVWVCDYVLGAATARTCVGGGYISLPSTLDRVQIVPAAGTFAASGIVNITYL